MNFYLEIPELDRHFPFRSFINKGDVLCYPHWHKEIEIIYVTQEPWIWELTIFRYG